MRIRAAILLGMGAVVALWVEAQQPAAAPGARQPTAKAGAKKPTARAVAVAPGPLAEVDHLVYAVPDLDSGAAAVEKLLGVKPSVGGQHPGRGTRNALVGLGPTSYLEILAPDPAQPEPKKPRSFKIDGLKTARLVGWGAHGRDLNALVADAAKKGIPLGALGSGGRKTPDGVELSWRFTDPDALLGGGIVPFFIDWGTSPHPAKTAPQGATLVALRAEYPDPPSVERILRALGVNLPVTRGAAPALIAVIECPKGRVELR